VVGIAGTHGKTTTTVMTTEALAGAGQNPTGIAGGRVNDWSGNARFGGDGLFVVEADEYDRSFLALTPAVAVINNVESDHLECYGTLEALEEAFGQYASSARRVLAGADDAGAMRVAGKLKVPVWRVGTGPDADLRIADVRQEVARTRARLALPGGRTVTITLRVPGLHNVRNAAMAIGVAAELGADVERASDALEQFGGVGRRFDLVGVTCGVTVVDDYAHHPSEISATIAAARQRYPGRRLVAVFQPHLFSRTQLLGHALGRALGAADLAVVTEVYAAREKPIAGVTGRQVADAVGGAVEWVPERARVVERVAGLVSEGDVVLTMGAGDITQVGPELLRRLAGAAA
jgi:UDP-N-acetylmuramate--alanine ligase